MDQSIQINEYEEMLKQAMLQSDISALDTLLADDLIFTNHLGHIMTKEDDIEAHKSNILKISEITLSEQKIRTYGAIAIVTVKAHIVGAFAGKKSENNFRFTRVWRNNPDKIWQVAVGHSCIVT